MSDKRGVDSQHASGLCCGPSRKVLLQAGVAMHALAGLVLKEWSLFLSSSKAITNHADLTWAVPMLYETVLMNFGLCWQQQSWDLAACPGMIMRVCARMSHQPHTPPQPPAAADSGLVVSTACHAVLLAHHHIHSSHNLALHAHCRNVVHRDLKLENLLLASPDEITKVRSHYCTSVMRPALYWLLAAVLVLSAAGQPVAGSHAVSLHSW